ncbi:MAG TPA: M20 family metallopeptidase [Clostridia bacterium]|nr:M20 family metallopeptidase [Clostridia bacterium]
MTDLIKEVKNIEEQMISWRRDLHRIPEIGLDLPKTSDYIRRALEDLGIEYKELLNGNALVGLIRGQEEGRTIALRADMDGLPVREETGLDFASKDGRMHACGHDGHMAMLLGAAKILQDKRHLLKGNVKLLFQPAEESPGGALPMIEEGALENPKVDAIIGLHNGNLHKDIPKGKIGVRFGPMMASADRVFITIKGKGAHGAYPEQSIDPITIAAELILALQTIISRETAAVDPAVLSICKIEGGYNTNIIPDEVKLEGTVRSFNRETRKMLARRIEEVTRGITATMGAECQIKYEFSYPALINSRSFTEFFIDSAKKIIPESDIVILTEPVMAAEDMAYLLEKVPGTFFFLNNIGEIEGLAYPHHNAKFDLDEGLFYKGTALLVQTVLDYLD